MNIFHGGRLATMPPKLVNEEGDLFVYRPLAHVAEKTATDFQVHSIIQLSLATCVVRKMDYSDNK